MLEGRLPLTRFVEEEKIDTFLNILCSDRIFNILNQCFELENKQEYRAKLETLLNNVYLVELSNGIQGITLLNKTIVINDELLFDEEYLNSAYRLINLLHELGHLAVRNTFFSAQEVIEYSSLESSFCNDPSENKTNGLVSEDKNQMMNSKIYLGPLNTSRIERSTSSKVESGYQLEKRIFGEDIKKLNEIQARFLLDPSS